MKGNQFHDLIQAHDNNELNNKNMYFNFGNNSIARHMDDHIDTDNENFPLDKKARRCNQIIQDVAIIQNRLGFEDSYNATTFPISTMDLLAGTSEYAFREDAEGRGISEIITLWIDGKKLEKIPFKNYEKSGTGIPTAYTIVGNKILFNKEPIDPIDEGIEFTYQRELDYFEEGDTTKEPPIIAEFHHLFHIGGAMYEARSKQYKQYSGLQKDYSEGLVIYEQYLRDKYTSNDLISLESDSSR